jgi:decaprenyl-phosphate phosphoribosyltransferase
MKTGIRAYIQIARPDHWFKNVFVLPGIVLVFFFRPSWWGLHQTSDILLGLVATCLITSSNYVLNEILDARHDQFHPTKKYRPIPSGLVSTPVAYAEFGLLAVAGIALAYVVNRYFAACGIALWIMGLLYNVPPIRLKDLPYADVLSESVNNPIRFLLGWFSTGFPALPPVSIVVAYWMFGAFLMATKRFAEYREIGDAQQAARYRRSFAHYTEERLLLCIIFYVALFAMFAGVFITRHHPDVILATPIVAYAVAYYLHLGFKPHSPVQYPEGLYKEHKLTLLLTLAILACTILLFVTVPRFEQMFSPDLLRLEIDGAAGASK